MYLSYTDFMIRDSYYAGLFRLNIVRSSCDEAEAHVHFHVCGMSSNIQLRLPALNCYE